MNVDLNDTIAAVASAPGPARRGIIRVTGGEAVAFVSQLVLEESNARTAILQTETNSHFPTELRLPGLQSQLPARLLVWPTRRSFTGQPMVEIHLIGAPPLLDAVLQQLFALGVRAANRGEFTLRAFLTGRIDLVQAEAVLGVIDAADHEELETALTQLGGGVTDSLKAVRQTILSLLGDLEAGLDFVEEDIEFVSKADLCRRLDEALNLLSSLEEQSEQRLPSGRRPRVVLAGLPNAGKSTLFNALAGTSKAIVSDVAGTTRDFLQAIVEVHGREIEFADTAGWESTTDEVMAQAQQLRASTTHQSDLILWCEAADLDAAAQEQNRQLFETVTKVAIPIIKVRTRCDLVDGEGQKPEADVSVAFPSGGPEPEKQGEVSVAEVREAVANRLQVDQSSKGELLGSTAVRCRDSLRRTIGSLKSAIDAAMADAGDEIISMELRDALQQLSTILGEVYTDDLLDHIFSNFCIGK